MTGHIYKTYLWEGKEYGRKATYNLLNLPKTKQNTNLRHTKEVRTVLGTNSPNMEGKLQTICSLLPSDGFTCPPSARTRLKRAITAMVHALNISCCVVSSRILHRKRSRAKCPLCPEVSDIKMVLKSHDGLLQLTLSCFKFPNCPWVTFNHIHTESLDSIPS